MRSYLLFQMAQDARRVAGDHGEGRHIFHYDRARPDYGARSNRHAGQNANVETDPDVAANAHRLHGHVCLDAT